MTIPFTGIAELYIDGAWRPASAGTRYRVARRVALSDVFSALP